MISTRETHRIGEAARLVGVSPSALRLWERQGLVAPTRTGRRYRLYTSADVERLRRIRAMRTRDHLNAPGILRLLDGTAARERSAGGANAGARLRQLRLAQGLTLREAADRAGLSAGYVSAIERRAAHPSVASLQRLTTAYGTTMLDLNDLIDPEAIPLGVDYACLIRSNVPVVVHFSRLDTGRDGLAMLGGVAFPVGEE